MSCIPKILEIKGDKEYLTMNKGSYEGDPGIAVESGGEYKGYHYLITFNDMGFRCGYVALPPNHPTNEEKSNYPDFDVHGGVTFFRKSHISEMILEEKSCDDKWIGFDAGHSGDNNDWELSYKVFPHSSMVEFKKQFPGLRTLCRYGTIKSADYMERQCKNLIDQLIEKAA